MRSTMPAAGSSTEGTMKRQASITVTMTLVLFMVISLLLVTLEHAYVTAGRTLALEAFDRSLESVLGQYYAPLYAEYGLSLG